MGQKVNPIGFRLGVNRTWDSRWYAEKGDFARLLHEDLKIKKHLKKPVPQRIQVICAPHGVGKTDLVLEMADAKKFPVRNLRTRF